jgi:lysophospholipase L1-like esterase
MDLKWDNESNDKVVNNQEYFVDVDTASIILFKSFIKDLKAENINILFVYSPEYIGGQNIFKNRNEMIGMFTQLAKEFEVPFLDYSDSIISSDRKLFYNNLHLTKEGADLFTNNIIDYLESNKTPEIKNNKMAKNNDSNIHKIKSFSINN